MDKTKITALFNKWINILRISNHFDVKLELIDDPEFKKTGDLKIDTDDKKAIIYLNILNPKYENIEEVIVHELLHLKLYPLDQLTENLIDSHYEINTPSYDLVYTQFMINLEQTVAELTKCFLLAFGDNKELSYGRCKSVKSFNELYEGLKSLK